MKINLNTALTSTLSWMVLLGGVLNVDAQDSWGTLSGEIVSAANENLPLENVLVWLVPDTIEELRVHPCLALASEYPVEISIANGKFDSKFALVRTGQKLEIHNNDTKGHAIVPLTFGSESSSSFPHRKTQTYSFDDAENVPGKLSCMIQDGLEIPLFILDHPYMTVTNSSGRFQIDLIPSGSWKFRFWHSQHGYLKDLEIPDKMLDRKGTVTLYINDTLVELGCLNLPANQLKNQQHDADEDGSAQRTIYPFQK